MANKPTLLCVLPGLLPSHLVKTANTAGCQQKSSIGFLVFSSLSWPALTPTAAWAPVLAQCSLMAILCILDVDHDFWKADFFIFVSPGPA
jgi:hypothetical protein